MKILRSPKFSPRGWIVIGIGVLVFLAAYYELVCRFTPFTRDAYLQAYVIQIAPQVAGWVTGVHVSNNGSVKRGRSSSTSILGRTDSRWRDSRPRSSKPDNRWLNSSEKSIVSSI
jgi:hypothetical protein